MSNPAVNFTYEASTNLTSSDIIFNKIGIIDMYVFGFSFMIGLPTNVYVIWLLLTGRGTGTPSEFFFLNLSFCELFFSMNSLLFFLTKWFRFLSLLASSQFFLGFVVTGSPLFQCLMCVERYLAVVHPVTFLKYKPFRYRLICCSVAWFIILGTCLIYMFSFLVFNAFMYMWFLSLQFLLFLSIQLFCCLAVLRALKRSGPGERKRERRAETYTNGRVFYLILITTVNTVIIYVPFTVSGLVSALTGQPSQILWSFSFISFTLANFVPPIIFLHQHGKLFCLHICNMIS